MIIISCSFQLHNTRRKIRHFGEQFCIRSEFSSFCSSINCGISKFPIEDICSHLSKMKKIVFHSFSSKTLSHNRFENPSKNKFEGKEVRTMETPSPEPRISENKNLHFKPWILQESLWIRYAATRPYPSNQTGHFPARKLRHCYINMISTDLPLRSIPSPKTRRSRVKSS